MGVTATPRRPPRMSRTIHSCHRNHITKLQPRIQGNTSSHRLPRLWVDHWLFGAPKTPAPPLLWTLVFAPPLGKQGKPGSQGLPPLLEASNMGGANKQQPLQLQRPGEFGASNQAAVPRNPEYFTALPCGLTDEDVKKGMAGYVPPLAYFRAPE